MQQNWRRFVQLCRMQQHTNEFLFYFAHDFLYWLKYTILSRWNNVNKAVELVQCENSIHGRVDVWRQACAKASIQCSILKTKTTQFVASIYLCVCGRPHEPEFVSKKNRALHNFLSSSSSLQLSIVVVVTRFIATCKETECLCVGEQKCSTMATESSAK